jgi:exodeoxyribonuclease VII large subunit
MELLAPRRGQAQATRAALLRGIAVEGDRKRGTLERVKAAMMALSPLAVLDRGYSITFDKATGLVVRSPDEVERGAALNIRLARGSLDAEVTGKE